MRIRLSAPWATLALLSVAALARAAEPVVIAHRGASGYLPEHTTEAVAYSHALGADFIEQDVVLSKDRVPVVLHDTQIDTVTDVAGKFADRRRPDGRFYAIDLTLAELKTLDVHERVDPRTGKPALPGRFPLGRGTFRIPTLDEELELIAGLNSSTGRRAGVYVEVKAPAWHRGQGYDPSPVVLATLARHGYRTKDDAFFVQCFEFDEVRRIRRELGFQGKLVQLLGGPEPTPERLAELTGLVDGIGPALTQVVRKGDGGALRPTELTQRAHAAGLLVHPYTVRVDALPEGVTAEALLRALFDAAKVDGVFIDHPDRAVASLRSRPATTDR